MLTALVESCKQPSYAGLASTYIQSSFGSNVSNQRAVGARLYSYGLFAKRVFTPS